MDSDLRVHLQADSVPSSMIIFGAIDFSVAIARMARELGYRVTIVDTRARFLASLRFSEVAETVFDWPDRYLAPRQLTTRDVVLVFSHDPKFDQPALTSALASGAGYVGALGSRRTHASGSSGFARRGSRRMTSSASPPPDVDPRAHRERRRAPFDELEEAGSDQGLDPRSPGRPSGTVVG